MKTGDDKVSFGTSNDDLGHAAAKELQRVGKMSEWVSVEDKLPEKYETVLIYDEEFSCVLAGYFRGINVISSWHCLRGEKAVVNYWMPFPNPPEFKDE